MSAEEEGYQATLHNPRARNPYRENCACNRKRPWDIGAVRATQELRASKHPARTGKTARMNFSSVSDFSS